MSFWNTSEGESLEKSTGSFDAGGGGLIPENTTAQAVITTATIDDFQGDEFINLTWTVQKPAAYANRKVFQKVRVWDADTKKADKAKKMLAAIDKNAGGKLLETGKEPTERTIQFLLNKPMLIKIMVWEMNDKSGNWVASVSPRDTGSPTSAPKSKDVDLDIGLDDDIPF